MGDKKPSTRTLPSGEKVTHHPDGRQVLLPRNSLAARLTEQQPEQQAASTALTEQLVQAATDKRESMIAGDPVPADKRVL